MIYTRLTTNAMNNNIINNMLSNRAGLNTIQEQISTGKRISNVSDDPSSAITALNAKTSINKLNIYSDNIDSATSELDVTEQAINSSISIVQRIRELTVQAATSTVGEDELSAIKAEVDQLIQEVKDIGNTTYCDKYIFGGLVTEDPAFTISGNEITYNGTSSGNYERKVEIMEGVTVPLNLSGLELFGEYSPSTSSESGLLSTLSNLSESLGTTPADHDEIRGYLDSIDDGLTTLLNAQSKVGGIQSRLEMTQNKIDADIISYKKFRSNAEDIDLAEAISNYSVQETTLTASLQVSAQMLQLSILDYL